MHDPAYLLFEMVQNLSTKENVYMIQFSLGPYYVRPSLYTEMCPVFVSVTLFEP